MGLPQIQGSDRPKALGEMDIKTLWTVMVDRDVPPKQRNEARMEFHEKFAIPFACLVLGLLALPLSLQSLSSRHSPGFGLPLVFFMGYYMLLALGWSAGETDGYPPIVAMWLPNGVMGGMAVYLIKRVAGEKFLHLPRPRIFWKRSK
jgi:lipopolysaccharide export system permease protein